MKFRLGTIAYVFALLAAAMAAFGIWGIAVAAWMGLAWGAYFSGSLRIRELWLSASIAAVLVALLIPASMGSHRGPSLRNSCVNNMKQIMLGLLNYEAAHGRFPPPYVADANGKPMHSWRVLILPYLEQAQLFKRYRMDEPWDGPHNRKLWDHMPDFYRCPGCEACRRSGVMPYGNAPSHASTYFAVVGDGTAWSTDRSRTFKELSAGGKHSLMVLEHGGQSFPWTAPIDLTAEEGVAALTQSDVAGHPQVSDSWFSACVTQEGRNMGTSDGHVRFVNRLVSERDARVMLDVGGAEIAERASIVHESTAWASRRKYERIYGAAIFLGVALWPAVGVWRLTKKPPV
jgi:hypothetical protein